MKLDMDAINKECLKDVENLGCNRGSWLNANFPSLVSFLLASQRIEKDKKEVGHD